MTFIGDGGARAGARISGVGGGRAVGRREGGEAGAEIVAPGELAPLGEGAGGGEALVDGNGLGEEGAGLGHGGGLLGALGEVDGELGER